MNVWETFVLPVGDEGYAYYLDGRQVLREDLTTVCGHAWVEHLEHKCDAIRPSEEDVRLLEAGHKHPAWKLMVRAFLEYHAPQMYRGDLFHHDAATLGRFNPDEFVWTIGETGTWLICKKHARGWYSIPGDHVCFHYKDNELRGVTPSEALDAIKEMAAESI